MYSTRLKNVNNSAAAARARRSIVRAVRLMRESRYTELEQARVCSEKAMSSNSTTISQRRHATGVPVLVAGWDCDDPPHLFPAEGEYSCGAGADDDLKISLRGVGQRHCVLRCDSGTLFVRRSQGHVWVNDVPVRAEHRLSLGDRLAIGPAVFRVDSLSSQQTDHAPEAVQQTVVATKTIVGSPTLPRADDRDTDDEELSDAPRHVDESAQAAAHRRLEAHVRKIEEQLRKRADDQRPPSSVDVVKYEPTDERLGAWIRELTRTIKERDARIAELIRQSSVLESTIYELTGKARPASDSDSLNDDEADGGNADHMPCRPESAIASCDESAAQHAAGEHHPAQMDLQELAEGNAAIEANAAIEERERQLDERTRDLDAREAAIEQQERDLLIESTAETAVDSSVAELARAAEEQEAALRLRDEIEEQRTQLADQEAVAHDRKAALQQLQDEIEEHRSCLMSRESELGHREAEIEQRAGEVQQRLLQLKQFRAQNEDLLAELPQVEATVAESRNLRSQLEDLRTQLRDSLDAGNWQQDRISELEEQCQKLAGENELLQDAIKQRNEKQAELEQQLESSDQESAALNDAVARLQTALETAATEIEAADELRQANAELQMTADDLSERLKLANEKAQRASSGHDTVHGELTRLSAELAAANQETRDWETRYECDVAARDERIEDLTRECERLLTELCDGLDHISSENRRLNGYALEPDADAASIPISPALQLAAMQQNIERLEAELHFAQEALATAEQDAAVAESRFLSEVNELEQQITTLIVERDSLLSSDDTSDTGFSCEDVTTGDQQQVVPNNDGADQENDATLLLRDELEQCESRLLETENRLLELEAERDELESRYATVVTESEQAVSDITQERDRLLEKNATLQRSLEEDRAALQEALECNHADAEVEAVAVELRDKTQQISELAEALKLAEQHGREQQEAALRAATELERLQADTESAVDVAAELETLRQEHQRTQSQRDELLVRIEELAEEQSRLMRALDSANALAESSSFEAEAEDLLRQVEELRTELDSASSGSAQPGEQFDAELLAKSQQIEHLSDQLAEAERFAQEQQEAAQLAAMRLEQLQAEAEAASAVVTELEEIQSQLSQTVAERDELLDRIGLLEQQFAELATRAEQLQGENTATGDSELVRLRGEISQRDEVIHELRDQLIALSADGSGESNESVSEERLSRLSAELDHRVTLLDSREEELRERYRQLERTEEDLETQRSQLQEARQQLEIARAEIQVAIDAGEAEPADESIADSELAHSVEQNDDNDRANSESVPGETEFNDVMKCVADYGDEPTSQKQQEEKVAEPTGLKSELASLFGLRPAAPPSEPDTQADSERERMDLSEPVGNTMQCDAAPGVELNFEEQDHQLVAPTFEHASAVESDKDRADDAVHNYMEDLLQRTRQLAGDFLPEELRAATPAETDRNKGDSPGERESRKDRAESSRDTGNGPVSFIEQYMSGAFGSLGIEGEKFDSDADSALKESRGNMPSTASTRVEIEALESRPSKRIDRDKLREHMNSFRSLSEKSVERALAAHAIRQQSQTSDLRLMITALLAIASVSLFTAGLIGLFSPTLTWLAFLASLGMGVDIVRTKIMLRDRMKKSVEQLESAQNAATIVAADLEANVDNIQHADSVEEPSDGTDGSSDANAAITPQQPSMIARTGTEVTSPSSGDSTSQNEQEVPAVESPADEETIRTSVVPTELLQALTGQAQAERQSDEDETAAP